MTSVTMIDTIAEENTFLRLLVPGAPGEGEVNFTTVDGEEGVDIFKYVEEHNIKLHEHVQQKVYELGLKLCQLVKYIDDEDEERPMFNHADYKLFAKLLDCVLQLGLNINKIRICFYPVEICEGHDDEEHHKVFKHINVPIIKAGIEICDALLSHSGFTVDE